MCFKHKSHHIRLPIKTLRCTLSLTGHHSRSVAWGNNVSHYEIYWQLSCFAAVYLSVRRMKGHSPPLLHRKESQGFSLLLWVFSFAVQKQLPVLVWKGAGAWSFCALIGKGAPGPHMEGLWCHHAAGGSAGGLLESGRRRWGCGWAGGPGWRPAFYSFVVWLMEAGPLVGTSALLPCLGGILLQCMKVKSESEVTESCPTLHDPVDCSLPGSSIHGISQARVLEWVAIAFSGKWL